LGAAFEEDMRSLVDNEPWYSPSLPVEELFRYRVLDHLEKGGDGLWIFESLRTSERKFLAEKLGIERSSIAGATSAQLAERILARLGLPLTKLAGVKHLRDDWNTLRSLVAAGEDEKAAVLGRQRAERLLRRLFLFYSATGYASAVLHLLADPGSLRVPKKFDGILSLPEPQQIDTLILILIQDDWAELGFLTVALRKLSIELERRKERNLSGSDLALITVKEQESFAGLAKALQAYAHDRPSTVETRKDELMISLQETAAAIEVMVQRNVIPDELLVLETGQSLLGPVTRGIAEGGRELKLLTDPSPQLGSRILYIAAAPRNYAKCVWVESPWPVDP